MAKVFDELRGLGEESLDYLRLRWTSLRLATVEKLAGAAARALGWMLAVALLFFALVFLMVALALWLGELSGYPSLGFLISGGGFLLVAAVTFCLGRRIFSGSMVRFFIDLLFTDKECEDGTRE